ncbi:serine-protein kinase ATM isoform X4 [Myotis daubentonii]|uniref:serine-protein kinase ATM isoform X4 n=1 Tax=Myotis daubentonii TaxID=98922 RepID=UPI002873A293|nr:serine-protein kinase ATM isoform X4 [Myotis daubentonii]
MSLALNDLLICCRQLEHDRATERRKEVEKFKQLIRDPETVQHLDRHSDSKQGKYLNWDAVFRFLQKYIQKETECLKTARPNVSASTQATRQKKMQEISSLVKYFIKCANKRAPRLKCQELLNYIMETVKDSSNGAIYRADCSNILLKDILSVRKYWCEISQQQWLELFSVYFKLYLNPSQDINRVLLARIIHALTKGCCSQTDGLNSKFLDCFSKAIQNARQEQTSAGLNHILAAFVIFLKALAINFRIKVCELGDEILPTFLYIWTQHRLNDSLKEVIIEIFQLQIYIHHPKGAKTQEKGAYESRKWKSILYNLYDLLVNEISHIGSRGKYSSGSRNIAVKENLIDLMADVCHQVFNEDTRSLEISQSYTTTQREYGVPCKKRKIELGWDVIKDHLQKSQSDFELVPWLQIVIQLISKYPACLPNCELSPLLMILCQLLPQQRRGERTPYVLRCLMEIALCQGKKSNLESSQKSELLKLWIKIWSITFRNISFEQIQAENFGLLGAIIQGSLVEIDREFWKLFTGSACRPSCPVISCLTLALTTCVVPETVKMGMEQNICEVNRSFSLKELIIKWLLLYQLEDDFENSTELPPILHSNFPHLALEKILVSLTMKNSKAAMNFFQSVPECEQHQNEKEEPSFSAVEELFLQTTFDKMDFLAVVEKCAIEKHQSSRGFSVHPNLKESLDRYLLGLSKQLLNNYSSETSNTEMLVRCSSLLVGVLGCYCHMGVITEEEAYKSELFQKAKSLMQCAGESVTLFKNKTNEESRIVSLRNMMHLCTSCLCNCKKHSPSKIASSFFLRLLTSKLMNDIADICRSLVSFIKKPLDYGQVESVGDDTDENVKEMENQSSMSVFNSYPASSVSDANESGESQLTIGAMNPLAEEHLSKQDLLFLDMLKFLCVGVTTAQTSPVSFRAVDIRRKLLMLIDPSILDLTKSLHLHMYLVLLKELPGEEYPLPMEDVVELLKPLSKLCSLYRRDQEVCKTILNHIVHIVGNLCQGSMDSENTKDAQGQFLTVIEAFWQLIKDRKCIFSVRMALVKCLKTLLEADPYSEWAILNSAGKTFSVNEVFPQFLADNDHQVRMLAAESINRLFQDMKQAGSSTLLKALPLKLQQTAFENAYLKAQEGMRAVSHSAENPELMDEIYNRKAVLLMTMAVVLYCSPVCEKQALFALCKSVKDNGLEPHLIKKVLEKVSETFGYRHLEDFMASHLDYLVLEWLNLQDTEHSLSAFPFILLNYTNIGDFYRSCYKVLIPHLVIRSDFDEVKSIANHIQKDWKCLLIDCFPKILVNILPYFAYESIGDTGMAQQRETATKVYDMLKDENLLGKQVLDLLKYLVIDNKDNENLYMMIKLLDPFPDHVVFKDLRITQQKIKYSRGPFSLLEEINHFLSVSVYDALPLTRLEGLKDLRRQLEQHKDQMVELMRASQGNPQDGIMVKLVVSLLQLSKMALNHTGEREVLEAVGSCLGEVGPVDFSTIAIQHSKDTSSIKALELFEDKELQWTLVMLTYLNNTLVEDCVKVRSATVTCLKNILATKTGHSFWEIYKTTTDPMLIYLHPFRTSRKKFLEVPRLDRESPLAGLDDTSLWIPQNESHDVWIKSLTCAFLDSGSIKSEILQLLKPLCEVKADFCQTVLPYLIHDVLLQDANESWRNLLSMHIQGFFTNCFRYSSQTNRSMTPASLDSEPEHFSRCCLDKRSQRTMLAVVDYLRRQKRSSSGTVFDDAFWLELNYLEVAKVAQSCAAHFTALLYAEIYADKKNMEDQEKRNLVFEEGSQSTTISSLSEKSKEETGISLQDLLLEIYRSIGEPDSLYGCGGGKMLQPLTRLRTYEHEAMWEKALVTYDLETAISSPTRQAGIIQALQNLGLCHILSVYLKGLDDENKEWCAELQELHYQAAWRNMQWDHCISVNKGIEGTSYHESLYNALQSLRDREFSTFYESLKYARVKEVEELCKGSLESVYSLYPTLSRLQAIGELESIGELFSRSVVERQPSEVYIKWRKHSQLLKDSDFSFQEPIMALRTVILELLMEKEMENSQRECFKDILTKHLVELSILARTFKNTQLPERAIFQIKQYNSTSCGVSGWQLEEAQVFWAKQEQSLALSILKQMIKKLDASCSEDDPNQKLIYTECLRVCGNWLAETCLENPAVIMQTYLEKAVEVAGNYDGESSDELRNGQMKAFLSLARFSDTQYQRIENYMKSSEFENKQALLKRAKEEVGLLREHNIQSNNRYTIKVQRELELDECALRALKVDRKRFLCKAVENYISCLLSGEGHDMWIFRLCSLWLENSGVSEVSGMMKRYGMKIPSYKFLPLMYQLAARMGTKMTGGLGFHEILNNLISRISMDHPHHTLFIILALANANKDESLTKSEAARRSRITKNAPKQSSQLDEDRTEAATKIISAIRSRRPQMVRNVETLCDAYIILANFDATQWKTQRKGIKIPADQPITKLKDLEDVVVPTMEIKVDPTGEYRNLVTIQSFKAEFRLAGGVNLPKIIDCVGSDGKERRQLVKGRDDLRQDAVMQQVFQMCNTLLQRNTETRKRKLTICTYKVVPLSQRSGVLEWCTGTVPIGEFLVNNENGAHKRYRPKDISAYQCQKKMMDAQKKSYEEKYETFMDICNNFQPVFRYFCMEKFLDPAVWFEKRLAYTRSVATSSIVGYILGLGDRHVQNILINEQSAELVHIDLGVAFEQGKILPTPETVPFRLTRDIVDGMGITGVEGVFRRCCEKTMEVMRNSKETLLTIVEVLLYDPLFDWTMNPLKALYLQQRLEDETELHPTPNADDRECKRNLSEIDQSFNKVAERVLMRLQEKLKGVEEGTVLSVDGQVNLLIQQAMDPKNLSRLFPGWKAWV